MPAMNRNLALEFVRATEMAALASARWMGRGDEKAADQAAVDAMRSMLNTIDCDATVAIGEGERDEAPMLYIGEKVGTGKGPSLDLAIDPLEGTTVCAIGASNSISVMAVAERGNFLNAPDTYMNKIATGPEGRNLIDLTDPPEENLRRLANAKNCKVSDLTVVVLDRPRHENLIQDIRRAGARIRLIGDGDVAAALACCKPESGVDMLLGIGAAPEGVIAAAALRCMGGDFQGQLHFRDEREKERAQGMGIHDLNKIYALEELAAGPVMFVATGVTTGTLLEGVRFGADRAFTQSMVMRSQSGTVRRIDTEHRFDMKPRY